MDYKFIYSVVSVLLTSNIINAEILNVNLGTDRPINEIDNRFLSFTIDPKYLFFSSEKFKNKQCLCIASSLSPSYIRVAGSSTSSLTFLNSSIMIQQRNTDHHLFSEESVEGQIIKMRQSDWRSFIKWAKNSGFDLVLALNNHHRTGVMWDANIALDMLTAAQKQQVGEMFWQLGYECRNQTIEEYLNDLETLRVIVETFPSGMSRKWKVVGADVSKCLNGNSKNDFKDYVITSNDMMDAIFLDGNSTSRELSAMSPREYSKLLQRLSRSDTPLWGSSKASSPRDRLSSLGTAAASGFTVHFQELMEDELCEPSLNLYTFLLFKHLVGTRVLSVSAPVPTPLVSPPGLSLFCHCSSLRGRPVPGAITVYGVNDQQQHAAFTLNITQHDGDILQFILEHDMTGSIIVNGRPATRDGHIRPVIKLGRSYKPLVFTLPPKSLGFWVLANAQITACYNKTTRLDYNEINRRFDDEDNFIKTKRSINENEDFISQESTEKSDGFSSVQNNIALRKRIEDINSELQKIFQSFDKKKYNANRVRREMCDDENNTRKSRALSRLKSRRSYEKARGNNGLAKISKFSKDKVGRIKNKLSRLRDTKRNSASRSTRKTENKYITHRESDGEPKTKESSLKNEILDNTKSSDEKKTRNRRSLSKNKSNRHLDEEEDSSENEIESSKEKIKIGKLFNNLKKLSELPIEIQSKDKLEDYKDDGSEEGIVLKTKLLDDSATIDITDKTKSGLLKSALQDILSLFADFNKNINRLWTAITILE